MNGHSASWGGAVVIASLMQNPWKLIAQSETLALPTLQPIAKLSARLLNQRDGWQTAIKLYDVIDAASALSLYGTL